MRRNQVTIKIERFGEEASNNHHQIIEVYADSNNIWEALAAANKEATNIIEKNTKLTYFGTVCSSSEEIKE